jgi:hypothetical protein
MMSRLEHHIEQSEQIQHDSAETKVPILSAVQ